MLHASLACGSEACVRRGQDLGPAEQGRHQSRPLHRRTTDGRSRDRGLSTGAGCSRGPPRATTPSNSPPVSSIEASGLPLRTGCRSPISPTSRPTPPGCTRRSSSMCSPAWLSAGKPPVVAGRPGDRRIRDGRRDRRAHRQLGPADPPQRPRRAVSVRALLRAARRQRHRRVGRLEERLPDNALVESFNGLYKWGLIYPKGPWSGFADVEFATLSCVDWFNNRRLHGQIQPPTARGVRAPARPTGPPRARSMFVSEVIGMILPGSRLLVADQQDRPQLHTPCNSPRVGARCRIRIARHAEGQ